MALKGKVETVLELKCTPHQFFNVWNGAAHQVPKHTPTNIHAVHLHEGDWDKAGSVKLWKYTIGGKAEEFKEKVEVDEQNMKIALVGVEGHPMKDYKVFKPTYYLAPKGSGCLATCIIEYEKRNPNVPPPDHYMEFMIGVTTDIDASIVAAK